MSAHAVASDWLVVVKVIVSLDIRLLVGVPRRKLTRRPSLLKPTIQILHIIWHSITDEHYQYPYLTVGSKYITISHILRSSNPVR